MNPNNSNNSNNDSNAANSNSRTRNTAITTRRGGYNRIGTHSNNNSNSNLNSDGADHEDGNYDDFINNNNNINNYSTNNSTNNYSGIMDEGNTRSTLNTPLSRDEDDDDDELRIVQQPSPLSSSSSTSALTGRRGRWRRGYNTGANDDDLDDGGGADSSTASNSKSTFIPPQQLNVSAPSDDKHKINVTILDPAQKKFSLSASTKWTTLTLKQEGTKIHCVQPNQQRLICMGKLLQDGMTLEEQGVNKDGVVVHLFPKPNVYVSDSNSLGSGNNNGNGNVNSGVEMSNVREEGGGGGAHIPQIILNSEEVSRRSQIVILSSQEAYEAMHRVRLLSFLLLAYCTLQILRDVTIYMAPPGAYQNYNNDGDDNMYVIPPGDPTDTTSNSMGSDEDQLPEWQNRYYAEFTISVLGVYVALLGMKATTDQVGSIAKRFLILLGILGVCWTGYVFYCHVIFNFALEKALSEGGDEDGSSGGRGSSDGLDRRTALKVSLLETILPLFIWVMFYVRALQFYLLVREAEEEAAERAVTLLPMRSNDSGGNSVSTGSNVDERGRNNLNGQQEHDLELQVEGHTIT